MMKAIIIDDEDRARRTTISLIKNLSEDIHIAGEAASVHEGVALIHSTQPDLIFLDIQMRDGTGFDLLDKVKPIESNIIFTTAYDEFALKAFRYNALDYLLKPIDPDQLKKTIAKIREQEQDSDELGKQIDQLFKSLRSDQVKTLALPSQQGIDYIHLTEIIYLNASGNYTTFYLSDGRKIIVTKTIKEYEEILPEDLFFRVHQSYIVRADQVKQYSKEDSSVYVSNGDLIPVAKRRRKEFLEWLVRK